MQSSQNRKQFFNQRIQQIFLFLGSVVFCFGVLGITETQLPQTQAIAAPQPRTLIAYEKDWQKDLERKEKTVEKHGKSVEKYVEQAQQYNAANPNSKIDTPSVVGKQVKSPRAGRQRKHKGFFERLFSSQSEES